MHNVLHTIPPYFERAELSLPNESETRLMSFNISLVNVLIKQGLIFKIG